MAESKILLNDVVIIRPLAIFLLIVWHSFIIYTGGWREPIGYEYVESYWWIAKVSYAFMLELFVFISGYVFEYSLQRKNSTFKGVVISKLKRLILPSVLFSVVYYIMFYNTSEFTVGDFIYEIIDGCGHMWFLPMLFWTTIIGYLFHVSKFSRISLFLLAIIMPSLSLIPLPLRISSAFYYLLFFYFGMVVFKNRECIIDKYSKSITYSAFLGLIFIVLFILGSLFEKVIVPQFSQSTSLLIKGGVYIVSKYVRITYALSGVVFIFLLVNYLLSRKVSEVPNWIKSLNTTCFGIYLYQQFILQALYYKTDLPIIAGPLILPWVGLVITLILSYLLTKLSLKTKIGRLLM